jgi:chromosome segregation ATPase|tara:strand:+ start:77 stop:445 length:369 start_codon:yes stop_codon:yes gene_type:complete
MKFKIIFGMVLVASIASVYSIITTTAGGITENKAGLTRLNKSFLSLSEEFQSIGRQTELIQDTRENYRNSLVELSNRLDSMDETNSEIYRILKELDEELNPEELGVNAGLGVLTGEHVLEDK